ncbi:transketolase [Candidatus Micrarchaeota archaeon]|nr:transketolase [Candidatus Micrarchaeota archaeon]
MLKEIRTDMKRLPLAANSIRQSVIRMLVEAKSGHPAGSLGMAEVFTALYFGVLRHDPTNPSWKERDRVVLSNGHICPVLYAALAEAGYFPKEHLLTLRKLGSPLQGHPHVGSLPGIENSSGPLGQGISQAVGMALVGKRENQDWRVYALLGDGELDEGQVWEACLLASKYSLDNLVAIIDRNNIQIDGTSDDVLPLEPLSEKFSSFGWNVVVVDGNNINAVLHAFSMAQSCADKPSVIIANTISGKGVSFMEKKFGWHGKSPNKEEGELALKELAEERKKLEAM